MKPGPAIRSGDVLEPIPAFTAPTPIFPRPVERADAARAHGPLYPADADLPPESPLDMPVQALWSSARRPLRFRFPDVDERRALLLIGVTLGLTAFGVAALYDVLAVDTLGGLDVLILMTFAPLFAWTAFSFASAVAGLTPTGRRGVLDFGPEGVTPTLSSRTAILAPIYNEAPGPLFARLEAMWLSLRATGQAEHFDIFVLSDTTDAVIARDEYSSFLAARRRHGDALFYRRRSENIDRKSGNIADWVRRFGGAYDFVVVLDADSLMEGDTLVRLAAAMERRSSVGLIQTTPVVIGRHSLFGRTEQFASRLYGPFLARGIAWWSGAQANYWGHNAILRVRAFASAAGLPHLPGRKPYGGHILSHDFVEAALMRRAGWEVRMAPELRGSYEESPPTLADLIARDRRWCQGNLQHLQVLNGSGFGWISRLHLLRGISSYLTAPLWLGLLVMSALLPLKPEWGVSNPYLADERAAFAIQPAVSTAGIFVIAMGFLLAPKVMAFCVMLTSAEERRRFGGAWKAFNSMMVEIALSALVAPVLMLNQVWALISILAGRDSGWNAQHREEGDISFEDAANHHLGDTAVGVFLGAAAWGASSNTFFWMLPVILGLIGCIPFAAWTARRGLGERARAAGLLVTPEEVDPPDVVRRFDDLLAARSAQPKLTPG
jgi:membrane glycosyltransferase